MVRSVLVLEIFKLVTKEFKLAMKEFKLAMMTFKLAMTTFNLVMKACLHFNPLLIHAIQKKINGSNRLNLIQVMKQSI